ncbi:glycosyltransferase family 4 protein [Candidatus Woesearchaeota archaeon]|nr:glycosyltransferase family 4 protein [Candidatus Woesearchaeota archaeon]
MKKAIWIEQDVSTAGFLKETIPAVIKRNNIKIIFINHESRRKYFNIFNKQINPKFFENFCFDIKRFYYLKLPFKIKKFLNKKKISKKDINFLFVESPTYSFISAKILKFFIKKPIIVRLGILPIEYAKYSFKKNKITYPFKLIALKIMLYVNYRLIDLFVVNNKLIANDIKKIYKRANIEIIPSCGVNIKNFFPVSKEKKKKLREKLNLPQKKIIGVYSGRLAIEKAGILSLVELSKWLEEKNMLLVFIGHGPLEKKIKDMIKSRNINNIILTGFLTSRDKTVPYLQAADVYIQPSLAEGHGVAPLEAMACKIPVISTVVGGLQYSINNKRNYVVSQPKKPESYKKAINSFLNSAKEEINTKIASSYNWVLENHSQENIEKKWEKVIKQLN